MGEGDGWRGGSSSRQTVLATYIILVLAGVPVWWKTTEVYKAELPLDVLKQGSFQRVPPLKLHFFFSSAIMQRHSAQADMTEAWLLKNVADEVQRTCHLRVTIVLKVFNIEGEAGKHDLEKEQQLRALVNNSSELSFFILAHAKDRPVGDELVMSSSGLFGWFSLPLLHETSSLLEDHLSKISRAVVHVVAGGAGSTGSKEMGLEQQQQQRVSPPRRSLRSHAYVLDRRVRIVISLLVGHTREAAGESRRSGQGGGRGGSAGGGEAVSWDIASANQKWLLPFIRKLRHVYDISVESQVLYFASLAVAPKYSSAHGAYVLTSDSLNDFINSKEWFFDSTTEMERTFHFLFFLPPKSLAPLRISSQSGELLESSAFVIQEYGGVYIFPSSLQESSISEDQLRVPMQHLVGQLRKLLGIQIPQNVRALFDHETALPTWQLDSFQRAVTVARVQETRKTLSSLKSLIDGMSNMVIRDEIRHGVQEAVERLGSAEEAWSRADFTNASEDAAFACERAENVFFDPSILSMLYFPDDHKFAIYVPYFVPVLLPILMGLLREIKETRAKKAAEKTR